MIKEKNMNSINELIVLCEKFKENAFEIKEFQSKLEEILLPDVCKHTLEKAQHNTHNNLEEIIYCYNKETGKIYAEKVAEELIQAAKAEQKRLENYKPYQE